MSINSVSKCEIAQIFIVLEEAMGKWKKSFRKLPSHLAQNLRNITSDNVKVLAGKLVKVEEVGDDVYEHVDLRTENLVVGKAWEVLPPAQVGVRSKRNQEGWVVVRDDLPKIKKYYYRDIPVYGDMKWSQKTGQSAKVYPKPLKGYENGEAPELYRPV